MTIRKVWATRVNGAEAATYVGKKGTIFFNEATGTLRISDGTTVGGNPLQLVADDFNFQFGDFVATQSEDLRLAAVLQSQHINQDIDIVSNGTGGINIQGNFGVFGTTNEINDNAVFRVTEAGFVSIYSPTVPAMTIGALAVIGSADRSYQTVNAAGQMFHIVGNDGVSTRSTIDAHGTGAFASITGRQSRGTAATPTATQDGDVLLRISAFGYAEPGYNTTNTGGPPTSIDFVATDNYTHSVYGSKIAFYTSADGSISRTLSLTVASTGITASTLTGKLIRAVRNAGTIAAGGTLTIDFATDDIVYCAWSDGMTLAYQNFTAGSVVRILATKSAGSGNNDPINLDGVTAANVSNGATVTANYTAATTACIELTCTGTTVGSVYVKL